MLLCRGRADLRCPGDDDCHSGNSEWRIRGFLYRLSLYLGIPRMYSGSGTCCFAIMEVKKRREKFISLTTDDSSKPGSEPTPVSPRLEDGPY